MVKVYDWLQQPLVPGGYAEPIQLSLLPLPASAQPAPVSNSSSSTELQLSEEEEPPAAPPALDRPGQLVPCDDSLPAKYSVEWCCSTLCTCTLPPVQPTPCECWLTHAPDSTVLIHRVEDLLHSVVLLSPVHPAVLLDSVPYLDATRYKQLVKQINAAAAEPLLPKIQQSACLTIGFILFFGGVESAAASRHSSGSPFITAQKSSLTLRL
jgi:hypothetical protein